MERGIEQLFFIIIVVLFTLLDLGTRWWRGRAERGKSRVGMQEDAPPDELPDELRDQRGVAQPQIPPRAQPPMPPLTPPRRPRQLHAAPPARISATRPLLARGEARRAIVLMTVIGPCRAEDPFD